MHETWHEPPERYYLSGLERGSRLFTWAGHLAGNGFRNDVLARRLFARSTFSPIFDFVDDRLSGVRDVKLHRVFSVVAVFLRRSLRASVKSYGFRKSNFSREKSTFSREKRVIARSDEVFLGFSRLIRPMQREGFTSHPCSDEVLGKQYFKA